MKNKKLAGVYKFIVFFLLIAFVVTCSFFLFFHFLDLPEEKIRQAAPVTFGNVVLITLIFWILDTLRRKFFTERPVMRIIKGLERISAGDFDTRIQPVSDLSGMAEYNEIIEYINKMAQELSGVETLRTDFVSNVSHEMKTPLAVIRNYSALLSADTISDQERKEYADAIDQATRRLSSLVENILKLNKLENQQIYPQKRTYDLSEQICQCLLEFESIWEEKNIDIDTSIDDCVTVTADPELLSIVWKNLISNAMKFTENGGTVSVSVQQSSGSVLVSVSDTGCGMDSDTGRHIFEKFYQGDTSHASKGNGLGLALVKRIVDITGADITVESQLGKGSTFTVKLPKEDAHGG